MSAYIDYFSIANPHSPEIYIGFSTLALINAGPAQSKNRRGLGWFPSSLIRGPIATLMIVALDKVKAE